MRKRNIDKRPIKPPKAFKVHHAQYTNGMKNAVKQRLPASVQEAADAGKF